MDTMDTMDTMAVLQAIRRAIEFMVREHPDVEPLLQQVTITENGTEVIIGNEEACALHVQTLKGPCVLALSDPIDPEDEE
jgi:hypothetical protein